MVNNNWTSWKTITQEDFFSFERSLNLLKEHNNNFQRILCNFIEFIIVEKALVLFMTLFTKKNWLLVATQSVKSWNIIIEKNIKLWELSWSSLGLFIMSLWMKYELLDYIIIPPFTIFLEAKLLIETLSLNHFKIIISWIECN